jgi:phosphatidylglycerophosphatase A
MPGTFASIAALFLFYLIKDNLLVYIALTSLALIAGFLVSGKAEQLSRIKDPRHIVIDEVAGQLLALLSLLFFRYDTLYLGIGFFLFRLLDTLKPYPAGRIQHLHGSLGIMGDDLIAAFYTNIILQVVLRFASCRIS